MRNTSIVFENFEIDRNFRYNVKCNGEKTQYIYIRTLTIIVIIKLKFLKNKDIYESIRK